MATRALDLDQSNMRACYMKFRCLLNQSKTGEAKATLLQLCAMEPHHRQHLGLVCLAVKDAFDASDRELASVALEFLYRQDGFDEGLAVLRCLVRLQVTLLNSRSETSSEALQSVARILQFGSGKLATCSADVSSQEVDWLAKVAWNLALDSQEQDLVTLTHTFFRLCFEFDQAAQDKSKSSRRTTAALMAASAALQIAEEASGQTRSSALEAGLEAMGWLQSLVNDGVVLSKQSSFLREVVQFRLLVLAGSVEKAGELLDVVAASSESCNRLVVFAAYAATNECPQLAINGLKLALAQLFVASPFDPVVTVRAFRQLCEIAVETDDCSQCVSLAPPLWQGLANEPPTLAATQQELAWIMISLWNWGVRLYSGQQRQQGRQVCEQSMQFLALVGQGQREEYEAHMSKTLMAMSEEAGK
eukprot:m.240062 g.240062  ORF g.240062 m.240062 type:complete len:418 (-) comp26583_c0_seq15:26-1279(-)